MENTINVNTCCVCLDDINEDKSHTLECGHSFHSSCIINWFRKGNSNCPLCNDKTITTNLGYFQKIETIKDIKKLSRKKSCPVVLKKKIEKIKIIEQQYKKAKEDHLTYKKLHKEIFNNEKKLMRNKWKISRKIRFLECQLLSSIILNPIYIKK